MSDTKYSWDGDWEAPGYGRYVICDNDGREMEPGEVVELLDRLADLQEQLARRPTRYEYSDARTPAERLEDETAEALF